MRNRIAKSILILSIFVLIFADVQAGVEPNPIYLPIFYRCSGARTPAFDPLPLPLFLNLGGCQLEDSQGRVFYGTKPWTPEFPIGYMDGQVKTRPVNSSSEHFTDDILYEEQLHGWSEFRIGNVPVGEYIVWVYFSEQLVHGPTLRTFNLALEGQTVLNGFDMYNQAGLNYLLLERFTTTVTDGELNINATPVSGDPVLAAVAIFPREPEPLGPVTPSAINARGSYNSVLLDWEDNQEIDLDGYLVFRSDSSGGPYSKLNSTPISLSRFVDKTAFPGQTYFYKLRAIDLYGNKSSFSGPVSATAVGTDQAALPVYKLEVPFTNLLSLYADPATETEVPGTFIFDGQSYDAEVRFRGSTSRSYPKKNWKIKFLDGILFEGQAKLNVNADFFDPNILRAKISFDLFEAAGLLPPQAEHVLLTLNGDYMGVYNRYEQVDEYFLQRTGRDPGTSIYKAVQQLMSLRESLEDYKKGYEKKTNTTTGYDDLIQLIEMVNLTPDDSFPYELRNVFNVRAYLDYYAVIVLSDNLDFTQHNAYLLHDHVTGMWELVPWDLDFSFYYPDGPINAGTTDKPGRAIGGPNPLLSRVLDVPEFRAYYCSQLQTYMATIYSDSTLHPIVDSTYSAIESDALRDWNKKGREDHGLFLNAPENIKNIITLRKNHLASQIPNYCSGETLFLAINEYMADNDTFICDPDDPDPGDCYEDWFEIYNLGLEPVNLQGFYLTDNPANPKKFKITAPIEIQPGGYSLFWADDEIGQGPNHVNFKLGAGGESISLYGSDGITLLDSRTFGPQIQDISEGRYPDGVDSWFQFINPTPGGTNLVLGPGITGTAHIPLIPAAADTVTVTTNIVDDGVVVDATLHYRVDSGSFITHTLTTAGGDQFTTVLPAQPSGSLVEYYIRAEDDDSQISTDPNFAPNQLFQYIVDPQILPLYINEWMPDNDYFLCDPDDPDPADCFEDWFEIYNAGGVSIDLAGFYLSDDPADLTQYQIPGTLVIPAGGHVIFWADNEDAQGTNHVNFKLSNSGESIVLVGPDGFTVHDSLLFGAQTTDISEGRCPDGSETRSFFDPATPGAANGPCSAYLEP